ncbi:MAG: hypothetical protein GC181_04470 [Bacteroidetes bacterium]|nr:hypothetical protein [Bacteroidota bacterium]
MKESEFIDQNKQKWSEFENIIQNKNVDPDDLKDTFIQVTDDLSYSRSNYPNRSVRVYVNQLARRIFDKLSKTQKLSLEPVINFYKTEVPQTMYLARREMLISLVVFLCSVIVGVYSSRQDPEFARFILGDDYVEMTLRNIENGDPMGVYHQGSEVHSFMFILVNNARIDILMLGLGILFGVGAVFVLITNGIMLGTFQYFFYQHGGWDESLVTIWLHGTIEISVLVLSGGIGFLAGRGLLFPGNFTRFQSFRIHAGNAAKLLLGILPYTLIAAFIESFVTGQTGAPELIKILLIIISLVLVVFYFVWLPFRVYREKGEELATETLYNDDVDPPFVFDEVKKLGEVLSEGFRFVRNNLGKYLSVSVIGAVIISGITAAVWPGQIDYFNSNYLRALYLALERVFRVNINELNPLQPDYGFEIFLGSVTGLVITAILLISLKSFIGESFKLKSVFNGWKFWVVFVMNIFCGFLLTTDLITLWPIVRNPIVWYLLLLNSALLLSEFYYKKEERILGAVVGMTLRFVPVILVSGLIYVFINLFLNTSILLLLKNTFESLMPFGAETIGAIEPYIEHTFYLIIYFVLYALTISFFMISIGSKIENRFAFKLTKELESLA